MSTETDPSRPSRSERTRTIRRAIGASAMGNMTEWFDYGVYAYAATYITDVFFPHTGVIATLLVFAVSFVFRPLGGMVSGRSVTGSAGSGCWPRRSR